MSEAAVEFKPNLDKIRRLQQQQASVVIGGKGVPRRKRKVIHKTAGVDDKKLQGVLKKLTTNTIPGIDEVNMFKDNGEVIHFVNPKVQASISSNIFAISGHSETKQLTEMFPSIIQQLGGENIMNLKSLAQQLGVSSLKEEDEDVPQLVDNFDEASKNEN